MPLPYLRSDTAQAQLENWIPASTSSARINWSSPLPLREGQGVGSESPIVGAEGQEFAAYSQEGGGRVTK